MPQKGSGSSVVMPSQTSAALAIGAASMEPESRPMNAELWHAVDEESPQYELYLSASAASEASDLLPRTGCGPLAGIALATIVQVVDVRQAAFVLHIPRNNTDGVADRFIGVVDLVLGQVDYKLECALGQSCALIVGVRMCLRTREGINSSCMNSII